MGGVSVIEWSDNIKDLIPSDSINLLFEINDDSSRTVTISGPVDFLDKLEIGE